LKWQVFQAVGFWMDVLCLQDSLYHTIKALLLPSLYQLGLPHLSSEIGQTGGLPYVES